MQMYNSFIVYCFCSLSLSLRPPSPLLDPVREKYTNDEKLVEDLKNALAGPELADVMFIVGKVCAEYAFVQCFLNVFLNG